MSTNLKAPPGPKGYPILGSMFAFQRDQLGFITRVAREYGVVTRYRLANLEFYQVVPPEGVQHILQDNHPNYIRGESWEIFRKMFGKGLILSEGAFWLRQRRLMQPAFHAKRIAAFDRIITDETMVAVERLHSHAAAGVPFDLLPEMTRLTMQVVTRALFSSEIGRSGVDDDMDSLGWAVTIALDNFAYRFDVPFYPPVSVPTPRNRRLIRALNTLDRTIYRIIAERRHKVEESGGGWGDDLLGMLLEAKDEDTGEIMDDRQVRDEVLTMFAAGHETTAVALSWAFYLLAQHPDVEERLRAEIQTALNGRTPTSADLGSLAYTKTVIEETLRLYPPAWITNRSAVEEDEILGYHIPARSTVTVSPYLTHHHPGYWENPEIFDPDRFSTQRSLGRPRYAYFPFGGGPHQCIGNGFALMEAQLILATLLQHFRFELTPGVQVEMVPRVTLRPSRVPVTARMAR